MEQTLKALVLGSRGMVGSALVRELKRKNYQQILSPVRSELDLLDQAQTHKYISHHKPDVIFLAAAKVGGILANNTLRADFIFENLSIQNNVIGAALKAQVPNFVFLGSSCIYPKMCSQPIKESYLLTGPLEPTNEPYALAKIAGLKLIESIRRQYGKNYFSLMPTNLYGENDNYDPAHSHVIPGLIRRLQQAIESDDKTFECWGTGKPRREFLYVDDLAEACVHLFEKSLNEKIPDWLNVGTGEDIEIKDLVHLIAQKMKYNGKIIFNESYPDGTPRKCLDVTEIKKWGWSAKTNLDQGLEKTIQLFLNQRQNEKSHHV